MDIATMYLGAANAAATLVAAHEVAVRWDEPSALDQMTVGALACHLARQVTMVPAMISDGETPAGAKVITVLDHYAQVEWVGAPLDAEVNVDTRQASAADAQAGPVELTHRTNTALAQLATLLPARGRPVYLPWTGWALSVDDFLTTRLLEIVIHLDDLAVSVDAETPALPEQATGTVIALLAKLSTRRHGPVALVRALARTERAPATIAAF
jgi:Mycothiol maleylpyruvate isomerase N-terminal domain